MISYPIQFYKKQEASEFAGISKSTLERRFEDSLKILGISKEDSPDIVLQKQGEVILFKKVVDNTLKEVYHWEFSENYLTQFKKSPIHTPINNVVKMVEKGQEEVHDKADYTQFLLEQIKEKDNTIKDIRETNKYLSISNRDLNQKIVQLLEAPKKENYE